MLLRTFRYLFAALALWAAVQASYLTYQAHQFLIQSYSTAGASVLALASIALVASSALAALGREAFYAPNLAVAVAAPLFLVIGLAQMGDVSLSQAYAQVVCSKGVGLCFPQAASFLQALFISAAVGGALVIHAHFRQMRGA